MKYCKDCARCDLGVGSTPPLAWPHGPAIHYWCHIPAEAVDPVSGNTLKVDPVSGNTLKLRPLPRPCHTMRAESGQCGPDAKLFIPRNREPAPTS